MPSAAKHWCFTLNNYTDEEFHALQALGTEKAYDIAYLVFGKEMGQEATPHLQGFVSFTKRKRLTQVKPIISNRAHLEPAGGSPRQASEYCKKDGMLSYAHLHERALILRMDRMFRRVWSSPRRKRYAHRPVPRC